jgi:hypothetical protein
MLLPIFVKLPLNGTQEDININICDIAAIVAKGHKTYIQYSEGRSAVVDMDAGKVMYQIRLALGDERRKVSED